MNKKISLILNILIVIFTILATTIMLTGFELFQTDIALSESNISFFKYYTVDSNILMGIVSLIYIIYLKKDKEIPKSIYILKLISTVGVTLTLTVVLFYLIPVFGKRFYILFTNANLFYHLLTPLLSIITFTKFEKTNKLSLKHSFLGIITMVIYAIFYVTNVLIHTHNGKVSTKYDWYYFVQGGVWTAVIVVPIIFLVTYLISFLLYKFNKQK